MYKNNPETQWHLKQPCLLVYLLSVWFMLSEDGASYSAGWPHTSLLTEWDLGLLVLYVLCALVRDQPPFLATKV